MSDLFCQLVRAAFCGGDVAPASDDEWQQCYNMALRQQVLAMTFPAMAALPKEHRPKHNMWSKWMAFADGTAKRSLHSREILKQIGTWLAEDGLSTMVIKGFSLAVLYPKPALRECHDIDIYSGDDFDAVNACLAKHGLTVGRADGHHVHVEVNGVMVENHFSFGNSRVKDDKNGMEKRLRQLAVLEPRATNLPGICFPNAVFRALYVAWHAYNHFLFQKIEIRHVIDWALCLKNLTDDEAVTLHEVRGDGRWCLFVDAMTAIALHRLGLPKEWFPKQERERAESVEAAAEQRIWDDIVVVERKEQNPNNIRERLNVVCRTLQNRWKFDTYDDMSPERHIWRNFVGFVFNS